MSDGEAIIVTNEQIIEKLEEIITGIKDGTFTGVFTVSYKGESFGLAVKGFAEDRVEAVDWIFYSMYREPNKESKEWFLEEMYKRWKHYFGKAYEEEIKLNKMGMYVT
jgi:hypothetical protein